MSIEDVELTLEKALQEALATRRAIRTRIEETEEELRKLRRWAADVDAIIEHTQAALSPSDRAVGEPPSSIAGSVSSTLAASEPLSPVAKSALPVSTPPVSQDELRPKTPRYEKPSVQLDIKPTSLRFRDLTIPQAATIVLRESDGPLHVNAIYNKLLEGGFEFHGDHPTITLAVTLSRSKRFRKVAPGTFDLVMRDVSEQRAVGSSS
jgi:hypothetical protein